MLNFTAIWYKMLKIKRLRGGGRVSNVLRGAKEQLAVAAVLPQSCHVFV